MAGQKFDTDGVHAIGNTNNHSRIADVVFVHGLGGKSHETWEHGKRDATDYFFWPRELADDLPDCGVWSVGYAAGMLNVGEKGMIIELRAGTIADNLTSVAKLGARPLIFVTHSMGGLIVKALITEGVARGSAEWKKLVHQVKGVVFCATPHRGSDIVASTKRLAKLFSGFQDHVLEMKANAPRLDTLHERFLQWRSEKNVPVLSYAESRGLLKRTFFFWLPDLVIVCRTDANTGVPEYPVRDTDETHISIVKPQNKESLVYAGVANFVRELRAELATKNGHAATDKFRKSKIRYRVGLAPADGKVTLSVTMTYDIQNVSGEVAPWHVIYVVPFFCKVKSMSLRFNGDIKPCGIVEDRGYKGLGGSFPLHPNEKADVCLEAAIEYPAAGHEVFSSFSPANGLTLEYTIHPDITHDIAPLCCRDTLDKVTKVGFSDVQIYTIEGNLLSLDGFRLQWTEKQ